MNLKFLEETHLLTMLLHLEVRESQERPKDTFFVTSRRALTCFLTVRSRMPHI